MSEKFYTPEEVARAILSKVSEMYKTSNLAKSNTSQEIEPGVIPSTDADCPEQLTGKGVAGAKKSKQVSGSKVKAQGEMFDGEGTSEPESEENESVDEAQDEEVAKEVVDEHNEAKHDEPEDEDSAWKETPKQKTEEKEKKKENPFMKKGIDNLKEFLYKREELTKGEKFQPKDAPKTPEHVKGVHKETNAMFNPGSSKAGNRQRFGMAHSSASTKKDVVATHKKVLAEQKKMPKPNLPKSECDMENDMEKAVVDQGKTVKQKVAARSERNKPLKGGSPEIKQLSGVHKPLVNPKSGTSEMGGHSNPASQKTHAKKVLGEMKQIKPNLPKSEEGV